MKQRGAFKNILWESVYKKKAQILFNGVEIMRAFVRLRQMLSAHKDLERKLRALERKYDRQFKVVFDAIRALMAPTQKPKRKIYPVKIISPPSTRP